MLTALTVAFGPFAIAVAEARGAMEHVSGVWAAMAAQQFTRVGTQRGLVGTQNATEAEIMRRQFTRVGAERGLVGTQNPTEAEIQRRQFTRVGAERGLVGVQNATERAMSLKAIAIGWLVGEALRGVGSVNPTQAMIYRRMAEAYCNRSGGPTGAGRL
jgi:hypothetical protein